MKPKTIIILIAVLALIGAGAYFYYQRSLDNRPKQYDTVAITRGSVERVIVSTGTLDPVGSVEVGTQVSGTIDKVFVDFNDTVQAGQIIAEIDRSVLMSRLTEVRASLSRAEALFAQGEQEFKRSEILHEKGLISEQDFVRSRTDYYTQRASLQVAGAAVNTAAENVRHATIRSPVRGTVISRKVDVGQTVAASLSAPTLFIIAEDLKKMKIMAMVDEADIGRIRPGQQVRFTVQAYPDKNYMGEVSQVRLQPEIVQNVVTYSVVVLADNEDGTLLPGMTANVEFIEAREENALTVPMSAFRFQPPDDVVKKFEEERKAKQGGDGGGGEAFGQKAADGARASGGRDGSARQRQQGQGERGGRQGGGQAQNRTRQPGASGGRGVLWTLDENNEFRPVYVRIGLNDGVRAVVTGGDDLREGLGVVTGEVRADRQRPQNTSNRSLLPQQQQRGVPRRM
ncbi:MAG: efflux RND transporter periplasmic adaptor subunit [Chitinispirillales bacterium]|jgi:HlyD family secretion protein|nr:efflux RND transporter periplasmic adaptor subunit [Chitinispirillales bacterium]